MPLVQPTASNSFFEPPAESEALPVLARLQYDGTDWVLATTGAQHGRLIPDENGDFVIVDVRTETLIIADGSDFTISTSGTRVRLLVADGDDVGFGSDLTAEPVAALYTDLGGNTVMIRDEGNPELKLLAVSGNYLGFQES